MEDGIDAKGVFMAESKVTVKENPIFFSLNLILNYGNLNHLCNLLKKDSETDNSGKSAELYRKLIVAYYARIKEHFIQK